MIYQTAKLRARPEFIEEAVRQAFKSWREEKAMDERARQAMLRAGERQRRGEII
jgi:hypothetical protein